MLTAKKFIDWPIRQRKYEIILALTLAIGFGLRAYGLFWDYPYFFNPDEGRLIEWGRDFNLFDPIASEWGSLPLLGIKLITITLSLFTTPDKYDIYPVARGFAVILGGATILLVYLLAKRAYDRQVALYAAIFTTFTVLLIQDVHFYSLDGIFAFGILAVLFPILSIARTGTIRSYIFAGVVIGLVAAVRLNGYFLLLPLVVAHGYNSFRQSATASQNPATQQRSKKVANFSLPANHPFYSKFVVLFDKKLWLAGLLSIVVFVLLNPALILDTKKFLFHDGLVWVMLQSGGYIKSRYTLQFEGTTPAFYFTNLLFWSAGPFLLPAYLAGVAHSFSRWRRVENLILLSFLLLYVWFGATSRVKFIRYCVPILPILNIVAANFFVAMQAKTQQARPLLKYGALAWLSLTIAGSALYALAFTNIYALPDPRIVASEWIQANIPAGAKIARGSNDYRGGLLEVEGENRAEYQLIKIDFDRLYRSSPPALESGFPPIFKELGIEVSRRGKDGNFNNGDFTPWSDEEKRRHIGERIRCADYIIFTERNYALYRDRAPLFPVEHQYYTKLFKGELGFQLVKVFERKPNLLGWKIDDSRAELTFHLFDHPTVWIFEAQPSLDFINNRPPQIQTETNWDNKARLIGYDIDQTTVKAGQDIQLTLYWETLANMEKDYTIFIHLLNDTNGVVAQSDHQAAGGVMPTSCWYPGRVVVDKTTLSISPEAIPGPYRLKLGLYSSETLERLAVVNDTSGENAVYLANIQVE